MSRTVLIGILLVLLVALGVSILLTNEELRTAIRGRVSLARPPVIESFSLTAGPVETLVVVTGSGFTDSNSINFGQVRGAIQNVPSSSGTRLAFSVPAIPCLPDEGCIPKVLPAPYPVSVSNANGTSKTLEFTVTSSTPSQVAYFKYTDNHEDTIILQMTDRTIFRQAREIITQELDRGFGGTIVPRAAAYNAPWSFYVQPSSIYFWESATEVCDAAIQYVEDHLAEVGGAFLPDNVWCPWEIDAELGEEVIPSGSRQTI